MPHGGAATSPSCSSRESRRVRTPTDQSGEPSRQTGESIPDGRSPAPGTTEDSAVPSATPEWITPELIRLTLKVWQPYYSKQLTAEDAVTIVRNAGQLFGLLSRE